MGTHKGGGDGERSSVGPANGQTEDPIELKDAVAFWQREVHYYEGRAGEQGASANRLVTIAAGAVAVASIFSTALKEQSLSPLLLAVPAVVCLMWATATRLLHEMELLRTYREHAEWRLRRLADSSSSLSPYRTWEELGAKHDMPPVITFTWLFLAGGISLAGTVGVIAVLSPTLDGWNSITWIVLVLIVFALVFTFVSNKRDRDKTRMALGMPCLTAKKSNRQLTGHAVQNSSSDPEELPRRPDGTYGPLIFPRDSA